MKDQLKLAEQIARRAHRDQFRHDGKTQYIVHVENVVDNLISRDEKILGWLHDVLEDSSMTKEDLFNNGIAECYIHMLDILTKKNHEIYINYINNLMDNVVAKTVKVADIVANLTDKPTRNQIKKYTKVLTFMVGG